jgi:lipoprotein-releasing system ATP-binding protein
MNKSPLELFRINRRFKQGEDYLNVLDSISLSLTAGKLTALVGPSGSGKTTLLNIAGLLERPNNGEVWVNGKNVSKLPESHRTIFRRKNIGFVFQVHRLLPEFNALENIVIPQMINGLIRSAAEKRAIQLLNMVNLENRKLHRPGQLSGGEQQRISIARALSNAPTVLLADEPTGNLDPATAADVFVHLKQIIYATNTAALIVTHNMKLAANMDEMLEMRNGTIVKVMG